MRIRVLFFYFTAICVGLLTGFVGALFQIAIEFLHLYFVRSVHRITLLHIPGPLVMVLSSVCLVFTAWLLVRYIAPEAAGSGIQEIEGALIYHRRLRWWRVVPVKFFAGILSNISFLVLGREGPSIQLGGNIGAMLGEWFGLNRARIETLVAAGAAAGLATAFNAPIAGVLFIIEEMRNAFHYSFSNFSVVGMACLFSCIVSNVMLGSHSALNMPIFEMPAISMLWLFVLLGIVIGYLGIFFNRLLIISLRLCDALTSKTRPLYILAVSMLLGVLGYYYPLSVGGGYDVIQSVLSFTPGLEILLLLFVFRLMTTLLSYNTGVPGGIFAPMLTLGTVFGLAFAQVVLLIWPENNIHPGVFAVAAMGALFASSVRAPLTGMILLVEMTQNYALLLPLMCSCLAASTVSQLAKNQAIYTQLMMRSLRKHAR